MSIKWQQVLIAGVFVFLLSYKLAREYHRTGSLLVAVLVTGLFAAACGLLAWSER